MDENVKEVGNEVGKDVLDAVDKVVKEELAIDYHELHAQKVAEMKEKYADVINDLSVRDGVDVGVAFDELKAIAYANLENEEVKYFTDIDFNLVELIRDYAELRYYSHKCNQLG